MRTLIVLFLATAVIAPLSTASAQGRTGQQNYSNQYSNPPANNYPGVTDNTYKSYNNYNNTETVPGQNACGGVNQC